MTLEQRFWSKVAVGATDECWGWVGGSNDGRGRFQLDGKPELAHRVAFLLTHGRWPAPRCLHTCDTPLCCNPTHLWEGTQADNMADKTNKDRQIKGEQHGRAKLNEARVEWIKARWAAGGMTQRRMADVLGVSRQTIGDIINGKKWKHLLKQAG